MRFPRILKVAKLGDRAIALASFNGLFGLGIATIRDRLQILGILCRQTQEKNLRNQVLTVELV